MISALNKSATVMCLNNRHLCDALRIQPPSAEYQQDYPDSDVYVRVFQGQQQ
jgi:hypothetical protein